MRSTKAALTSLALLTFVLCGQSSAHAEDIVPGGDCYSGENTWINVYTYVIWFSISCTVEITEEVAHQVAEKQLNHLADNSAAASYIVEHNIRTLDRMTTTDLKHWEVAFKSPESDARIN